MSDRMRYLVMVEVRRGRISATMTDRSCRSPPDFRSAILMRVRLLDWALLCVGHLLPLTVFWPLISNTLNFHTPSPTFAQVPCFHLTFRVLHPVPDLSRALLHPMFFRRPLLHIILV